MKRRTFLAAAAGAAVSPAASGVRITRITLTPIEGRFHKFVSMNAYDERPKGETYGTTLIRIATDSGIEGVGVMDYSAPDDAYRSAIRNLIGVDPLAVFTMERGIVARPAPGFAALLGRYPHLDGPLLDLTGQLTRRPLWALLGSQQRNAVEVYDGTLYFADQWFKKDGVQAVVREAEEAAARGYLGMKLKTGRGRRWMEREAGLIADIAVVKAVRKAVGSRIRILVDANDGYRRNVEDAWRFISETAAERVHLAEEMFPENVAAYSELRDRMDRAGIRTLIGDGENMGKIEQAEPYLRPRRLIDVMQIDIRNAGLLRHRQIAHGMAAVGGHSIPHNWASHIGGLMGVQLSAACKAVTAAEDDRSTFDVLILDGYEFRNGQYRVPDSPGMSIHIDEATYRRRYASREEIISG